MKKTIRVLVIIVALYNSSANATLIEGFTNSSDFAASHTQSVGSITLTRPGPVHVLLAGFFSGSNGDSDTHLQILVDGVVIATMSDAIDSTASFRTTVDVAGVGSSGELSAGVHAITIFSGYSSATTSGADMRFFSGNLIAIAPNEPSVVDGELQAQLDALSFVQAVTDNGDGTITFTYRDGTSLTINTGTLIDLVDNGDGTITFTHSDGSSSDIDLGRVDDLSQVGSTITVTYTDGTTRTLNAGGLDSVRPVAGGLEFTYLDGTVQTIPYPNFIESVTQNGDRLEFTYSDGTTFTTESIVGPVGPAGTSGGRGRSGKDGENGQDGKNGSDGDDGKIIAGIGAGILAGLIGAKLFSGGGGLVKRAEKPPALSVVEMDQAATIPVPVYYQVTAPIATTVVDGEASTTFGEAYLPTTNIPAEYFPQAVYIADEGESSANSNPEGSQ